MTAAVSARKRARHMTWDECEVAIEDFLWLLEVGEHVDRALARVGVGAIAMVKMMRRHNVAQPEALGEANYRATSRAAAVNRG